MKTDRKRRITYCVAGMTTVIVVLSFYGRIHRYYCDQALIAAIQRGDRTGVIALLASGSNPNVRVPMYPPVSSYNHMIRLVRRSASRASLEAVPDAPALCAGLERMSGTDVYNVASEDPMITEALLQYGSNVNATDEDGQTALGWAVLLRRPKTVRLLLNQGANPNTSVCLTYDMKMNVGRHRDRLFLSRCERTSLLQEVLSQVNGGQESAEIARMLVLHGASAKITGRHKITPLMIAVLAGDRNRVQSLIKTGPDINARTGDDTSLEVLAGFDTNYHYRAGSTILGWLNLCLPREGDLEIKHMLLKAGGKERDENSYGRTCNRQVVWRNRFDFCLCLRICTADDRSSLHDRQGKALSKICLYR